MTAFSEISVDPKQVQEGVESLLERGYYIIPEALNSAEIALATEVLDTIVAEGQAGDGGGGFGYAIHPLVTRDARISDLFCHPLALAILGALFEDAVRLMHSGSRITDARHTPRLGWHIHRPSAEECDLHPGDTVRGAYPRRALLNYYLEGLTPETGPLVALPRRYDDPLAPPSPDMHTPWPGEAAVTCPPGSAVLFTTDMWHAALAGTNGNRRRLFGGHWQGWSVTELHREDQMQEGPEVEEAIARNPIFAGLMRR